MYLPVLSEKYYILKKLERSLQHAVIVASEISQIYPRYHVSPVKTYECPRAFIENNAVTLTITPYKAKYSCAVTPRKQTVRRYAKK